MSDQFIREYPGVLTADDCQAWINKFAKDTRVSPDPQPDYSSRHYLNLSEQSDWLPEVTRLLEVTNDLAEDFFSRPEGLEETAVADWIDDGFIMSHYRSGDDLALHVDGQNAEFPFNGLRLATVVFFLNQSTGGELVFPLQGISIRPQVGKAVVFPPDYSYPHKVNQVQDNRFIVQTWLTDPSLMVVEREWED